MQTLAADSRPGGFAVVECKRWRWGLPLVHAESWLGDFPISRTPLLNPSDPAGNCAALIEEIFDRTDAAALLLPYVTGHYVVSSVLVNIRGEKFVHLVDNADGMLVSEEAREIAPSKHRNQHYEPSFEDRTQVFTLNAGDGVHIPYTQPHWVRTGAD